MFLENEKLDEQLFKTQNRFLFFGIHKFHFFRKGFVVFVLNEEKINSSVISNEIESLYSVLVIINSIRTVLLKKL
jgi:hypothetical protein